MTAARHAPLGLSFALPYYLAAAGGLAGIAAVLGRYRMALKRQPPRYVGRRRHLHARHRRLA